MGQQTSFMEFSQEIAQLHNIECKSFSAKSDAQVWKVLFLTPMTDEEICTFFNFDDVRRMRRFHPDRLALILFKCLEQLIHFANHGSDISDYCSVMNAVRMLGNALPYCFEDINLKGTEIKHTTITSKKTKELRGDGTLAESPFATNFANHFFWENKTCEGTDLEHCSHVKSWTFTNQDQFERYPLGELLIVTLTRLCFIPRFTVGPLQTISTSTQEEMSSETKTSKLVVHEELLWYGCSVPTGTVAFRQVDPRRIQVLRTLIQSLSVNVFEGRDDLHNPFLDVLVDDGRNPLGPTLCQTLINRIATHFSRGSLPYTSYIAADSAEKILEYSLSLLSISFDRPSRAVNCFLQVLEKMDSSQSTAAENLIVGLHRVIENPLFASHTMLKESQKVVRCTLEATILLFHILEFPQSRWHAVKVAPRLVYPLLYVIQECARKDNMIYEMQAVMYVLLRLSSENAFLKTVINEPIAAQPPLFVLPQLMQASGTERPTYADVIVLMMCFIISPASPRWFLPVYPAAGTIFANIVAAADTLTEATCFEVHHALEFLTHKNVLKKGANCQRACQLWVEGIVTIVQRRPMGCVPLIASLGVGTAAADLRNAIDGICDNQAALENAPPAQAVVAADGNNAPPEAPKPAMARIKFIPGFGADMPLEELMTLSSESKKKLESSHLDGSTALAGNRSDVYEVMKRKDAQDSGLIIPSPSTVAPFIRHTVVTQELRRWFSGVCWRTLHQHNTRPPIYDFQTVKLY